MAMDHQGSRVAKEATDATMEQQGRLHGRQAKRQVRQQGNDIRSSVVSLVAHLVASFVASLVASLASFTSIAFFANAVSTVSLWGDLSLD